MTVKKSISKVDKSRKSTKSKVGRKKGAVKTGGRKKNTPNKTTALLKDAILQAAANVGLDGNGKEGLTGYCQRLAASEPKAFATLLSKVMPLQIAGDSDNPLQTITEIRLVAPNDKG